MRAKKLANSSGFSLVELLLTIVILGIVLAVVGQTVMQAQGQYVEQRRRVEAQNHARTALDLMTRLIRQAGSNPREIAGLQAVLPDPDGNAQLDSIRIQADWNPPDGALNDPYEDVILTTDGVSLFIREPADPAPVEFLEGISQMSFQYFDADGAAIANPIANAATIASVDITLTCNIPDSQALTLRTSATVRGRE
jgi:prepilin-type N-terminal cleavage/methylation domain-containing protein